MSSRCPPDQPVFAEPTGKRALSARRIQLLVRQTAKRAGLEKTVLPITLRHSYAVHFLQDGGNIRQLQDHLDHRMLETTARYLDLVALPTREPPPPPVNLGASKSFLHDLTNRFVRKVRGLRIFHNTT